MSDFFEIKWATKVHTPIILELINELANFEKLANQLEVNEEKIAEYLFGQKAFAECLLSFENNIPVGFALFFNNYSTFVGKPGIYLEDLFIKEKYRGKGYGKKMLLAIVKLAHENNCGRVEWSVLNWNQSAINFYESLGATPMKEWTVYRLNEDTINKLVK